MDAIMDAPAFWGFFGALVYAGTALIRRLWGDRPARGDTVKLVWAEFAIAVIFGPVAAEGFGPSIFKWFPAMDERALALTIGLSANYLWPLAVEALGVGMVKRITGSKDP